MNIDQILGFTLIGIGVIVSIMMLFSAVKELKNRGISTTNNRTKK